MHAAVSPLFRYWPLSAALWPLWGLLAGARARGRSRPRGLGLTLLASPYGNPRADGQAGTFTGCRQGGPRQVAAATPATPPPPSSSTVCGSSTSGHFDGSGTVGYRGQPEPAATVGCEHHLVAVIGPLELCTARCSCGSTFGPEPWPAPLHLLWRHRHFTGPS